MLILSGAERGNAVTRLLATPVPLFIGLISYSLYLWHWPIFVALSYYFAGDLPPLVALAGLVVSVALATFSWRYVERLPRRKNFLSRGAVFAIAGAFSFVLAAIGFTYYRTDGMASRFPARHAALVKASNDFLQNGGYCVEAQNDDIPGLAHCRLGKTEEAPTFLVWADSHGRAYRDGIDALAKDLGRSGLMVWDGGCPPIKDIGKSEIIATADDNATCRTRNDRLVQYLERDRALRTVIFIGRWSYYTEGTGLGRDASNAVTLSGPDGRTAPTLEAQQALFGAAFESTVDWLRGQGRRVFVVEQTPEIPDMNARFLAQQIVTGRITEQEARQHYAQAPRAQVERRQAVAQDLFRRLAGAGKISVLGTHGAFCDGSICSGWHDDAPALFDNNHVMVATSLRLRDIFRPALEQTPAP